jgi:hypothetical protein
MFFDPRASGENRHTGTPVSWSSARRVLVEAPVTYTLPSATMVPPMMNTPEGRSEILVIHSGLGCIAAPPRTK